MQYRVAAIGGDGIGPEIIAAGREVLDAAGERYGFDIDWTEFDIGAERYLASGELLTEEDIQELSKFPAIYFGAIGDERWAGTGILLAIGSISTSLNLRLYGCEERPCESVRRTFWWSGRTRRTSAGSDRGGASRQEVLRRFTHRVRSERDRLHTTVSSPARQGIHYAFIAAEEEGHLGRQGKRPLRRLRSMAGRLLGGCRRLSGRLDGVQLCRRCHDVVPEEPRVVRCCRHAEHVWRYNHRSRRHDTGRTRSCAGREHQPLRHLDV